MVIVTLMASTTINLSFAFMCNGKHESAIEESATNIMWLVSIKSVIGQKFPCDGKQFYIVVLKSAFDTNSKLTNTALEADYLQVMKSSIKFCTS